MPTAKGWSPACRWRPWWTPWAPATASRSGVVSALLEGLPLPDAVARGNWIGSRAVQVRGDMEGLPKRSQLLDRERRRSA